MLQPYIPQQRIIPLLVQEQLPVPPQPRVHLAMLVEIWSVAPAAIACVQVENIAFADVDEKANGAAASGDGDQYKDMKGERTTYLIMCCEQPPVPSLWQQMA